MDTSEYNEQFNKTLKELSKVHPGFEALTKIYLPEVELWQVTEDILYYFTEDRFENLRDKDGIYRLDCGGPRCLKRCCVKCAMYETYDVNHEIDYFDYISEEKTVQKGEGPSRCTEEDWENIYSILNALSKGIIFDQELKYLPEKAFPAFKNAESCWKEVIIPSVDLSFSEKLSNC